MQSAVSHFTVRDLRGGPLEICRAFGSCCLSYAFLLVDLCGSLALFSESLRILAPSRPSRLVGGSLGKYGSGKLFSTDYSVWRCQLAAACGGGSRFQGCHGYLPSGLRLLLPANLLGTSSQAHLFVMSLKKENSRLGESLQWICSIQSLRMFVTDSAVSSLICRFPVFISSVQICLLGLGKIALQC